MRVAVELPQPVDLAGDRRDRRVACRAGPWRSTTATRPTGRRGSAVPGRQRVDPPPWPPPDAPTAVAAGTVGAAPVRSPNARSSRLASRWPRGASPRSAARSCATVSATVGIALPPRFRCRHGCRARCPSRPPAQRGPRPRDAWRRRLVPAPSCGSWRRRTVAVGVGEASAAAHPLDRARRRHRPPARRRLSRVPARAAPESPLSGVGRPLGLRYRGRVEREIGRFAAGIEVGVLRRIVAGDLLRRDRPSVS